MPLGIHKNNVTHLDLGLLHMRLINFQASLWSVCLGSYIASQPATLADCLTNARMLASMSNLAAHASKNSQLLPLAVSPYIILVHFLDCHKLAYELFKNLMMLKLRSQLLEQQESVPRTLTPRSH